MFVWIVVVVVVVVVVAVLMASTSNGEHLALHGVAATPFHHVHKFKTGSNSVAQAIDHVHTQCGADVQRLCSVMPRIPVENPVLSQLLYNAAKERDFPLMRMAFPQLEPQKSSLELLDDLMSPPKIGIVRLRFLPPQEEKKHDDTTATTTSSLDHLVEEMVQDSIKFSNNAKVVPEPGSKEEEDKDGLKEAIAEETLSVLVNSLLDHTTSASASADSEEEDAASRYDPVFVSKQISQYGQKIVDNATTKDQEEEKKSDHELRQRLARRLTEVTPFRGMPPCQKRRAHLMSHALAPPMIMSPLSTHRHNPFHGIFPPSIEKCMLAAKEKHILSGTCDLAMSKVIMARANYQKEVNQRVNHHSALHERMMLWHQTNPNEAHHHHQPCSMRRRFGLFLHFFSKFIFATSMFYLVYLGHKLTTKRRKRRFQKVKKIMYTIHNNPELKSAVEESLGESIQHDSDQDTSSCLTFFDALFDMLPILGLIILLMHVAAYSPNFVIMIGSPILGLTTCYSFLRQTCKNSIDEASADGYVPLVEEEEMSTPPKKAKTHVYEGVPVQVV